MDEFPTKLEQIISLSFNFDSLIKVLQFLNKKNNDLEKQVKSISKHFLSIDKLREEVDDIHIKNTVFQNKFNEVEGSLTNHSLKLLENDGKLNNILLLTDSMKSQTDDKFQAHEDNLNNLNRVLEEQVKGSTKLNERTNQIEYNTRDSIFKINKGLDDIKLVTTNADKMKDRFDEIMIDFYELRDDFEKKHNSLEKTISTIIGKPVDQLFPNNNVDGNVTPTPAYNEELEKIQKRINELCNDNVELNDLIQSQNEENKEEFKSLNMKLVQIEKRGRSSLSNNNKSIDNNELSNSENIDNEEQKNKVQNVNNNSIQNKTELEKMNHTILQLHELIMEKVNQTEYDTQNNILLAKIETINDKLKESLKNFDSKIKSTFIPSSSNENSLLMGTLVDLESVTQTIEKQLMNNIQLMIKEASSKLEAEGDFSNNSTIYNMNIILNKQKEDIDQAFKSIVNIRRIIGSNEMVEDIKDIKARIEISDDEYKKLRNLVFEIKREFEGEEEIVASKGKQLMTKGPNNLRILIPSFQTTIKDNGDRITYLERNQSNMTNDVKDAIKSSLRMDIEKVIEQFQKNLNAFTNKFEYQLKNKIDQIGLTSFEYKVNSRLSNEIRDKIDKGDLKKNNNVINRKFDALENKISKTLVDTIIDLQMDEAPLIVKKNNKNIEKCASCNQVLQAQPINTPFAMMNENHNMMMNSASMSKMRMSKYNIKDRDKLPDLSSKGHHDNYVFGD